MTIFTISTFSIIFMIDQPRFVNYLKFREVSILRPELNPLELFCKVIMQSVQSKSLSYLAGFSSIGFGSSAEYPV